MSLVLKENTYLNALNLSMNKIDDINCARILKSLAHNHSLEKLDLSTNLLGDISVLALDFALKTNKTVKELDLSNSLFYISDELKVSVENCPSLIKLDLRNTKTKYSKFVLLKNSDDEKYISDLLIKKSVKMFRNKGKVKK